MCRFSGTHRAEADPTDLIEGIEGDYANLQPDLAEWLRRHDRSKYQALILGSNDRLIRYLLFQAARWLLTGVERNINQLERIGDGSDAVEDLVNKIAKQNGEDRDLLWTTVRIELPPLPLRTGDGDRFEQGVREAFRTFVRERADLAPLLVPLRVTVLVIPPVRPRAATKDLDNTLITLMRIIEQVLASSTLRAYQVIELHRQPGDSDHGAVILVPGLGWNHWSVWTEAERFVQRKLARTLGRPHAV